MQTGRIKIVLYVDGHWAYNYPTQALRDLLGKQAHEASGRAYDSFEPLKSLEVIEVQAWPEQRDDLD